MARPREFDESKVVQQASLAFAELGYNGCSIDDLLAATALKRGSLYKAFGSKRNLFVACLSEAISGAWVKSATSVDLVIVAMRELARSDKAIKQICTKAIDGSFKGNKSKAAQFLGGHLLSSLEN